MGLLQVMPFDLLLIIIAKYLMYSLGGEDYGHLHTDIVLTNKRSRECAGIAIYEDKNAEMDEYFEVQIDEFGISTRVVILDDDGKNNVHYYSQNKLTCYMFAQFFDS